MTDKTKSVIKIVSGVLIGAGAVGWISAGGTEAGAMGIVAAGIALVGAVVAFISAVK